MTKRPGLKEIKNTYFLRQIEPIINQLVETHKIPKEEVEEIITHFFDKLKDYVQSPFMPKVMIENFGTFKPSYKKISNYMRRMLYLRKIDRISLEITKKIISELWPIKNRLAEEDSGVNTWKKYRKEFRKTWK